MNCDLCVPYWTLLIRVGGRAVLGMSSLYLTNLHEVDRCKKSQNDSGYSVMKLGMPTKVRQSCIFRKIPLSVNQFCSGTGHERRISRNISSAGLLVGQGGGGRSALLPIVWGRDDGTSMNANPLANKFISKYITKMKRKQPVDEGMLMQGGAGRGFRNLCRILGDYAT